MAQEPLAKAEVQENAKEVSKETPDNSLNNLGKNETKTLDQRLESATSPEEIAKITSEAIEGKFKEEEKAEDKSEADADPEKSPKEEVEKADPPEDSGKEEKEPEEEAAKKEEEKTDDGDDEEGKLPNRIRTTDFSDVEKMALQIKRTAKKAGKDISLAEAESRARLALGIEEPSATKDGQTKTADNQADDGMPKTMDELSAKLKDLVAKRTKAFEEDLDFKAANQLTLEIEALKDHRDTLKTRAADTAKNAQAVYDAAYSKAESKAAEMYDFVGQKDSEGFKRMLELEAHFEATKDPLHLDPEKPLVLARMVARELAIAPKTAGVKPVVRSVLSNKQQPPPVVKKGVPPVASGTSRTSSTNPQGAALSAKIDSLRTPEDIEKFIAESGG